MPFFKTIKGFSLQSGLVRICIEFQETFLTGFQNLLGFQNPNLISSKTFYKPKTQQTQSKSPTKAEPQKQ